MVRSSSASRLFCEDDVIVIGDDGSITPRNKRGRDNTERNKRGRDGPAVTVHPAT